MSLHRAIIKNLLTRPMSLADLQSATQVSLPTLNRAVRELTDARWACVVGQAEPNGGRPAMLFGIDSRFHVVVGLHLQLPGIHLIACDLCGQVLDESEMFRGAVPTPSESVGVVVGYVEHIRTAFPERRILGIGIAAPGFMDLGTGDIISIGRVPNWENFAICRHLQAAVDIPVSIANDVDCMAFAELQHVGEPLEKNLAYVGYDEGVKISLFLKGELYRGSLGNAGLISSHLLSVDTAIDHQAAKSLLTIRGVNHTFDEMLGQLDAGAQAAYAGLVATTNPRQRFRSIMDSAAGGLPVCQAIAHNLSRVLAAAVANTIYIVQPDVVVIGGLLSSLPKVLFADLEAAIREHLPALISNNTIIQQGGLVSENTAAIGANHHFLQCYVADSATDLV